MEDERVTLLDKIGENPKIKTYMGTRLKEVIGSEGKVNGLRFHLGGNQISKFLLQVRLFIFKAVSQSLIF